MAINVEQISAIIKDQIKRYDKKTSYSEVGYVVSIFDGIALINGLDKVMNGEIVSFPGNLQGMALALEEEMIGVVLLGDYAHVKGGDEVKLTGKLVSVNTGDSLLGRTVNSLGQPIDGDGPLKNTKLRPIEDIAPGIMDRQSVSQPLETGILSIDSMIPIGKGQRELIIGDRQTGKTAIAIDAILNQKGKNVNCIYVAIGQKNSTTLNTVEKLKEHDALKYTTIVSAGSSDEDSLQYIAPYAGMSIAEKWMQEGKDVLIIFDDLSKHAVAYRAISLLLRRPPGREAYPGDVFYLHSRLLERSARLSKEKGGGSITALPIVETQAGDISAYIPTNIISITDGQIFLKTDAFNSGIRPAIDSGLSVSRVGSAAQTQAMKSTSSSLKLNIAQFQEVESFSQFGSDLDDATKQILSEGKLIREILKQKQFSPLEQTDQAIILFVVKEQMALDLPTEKIEEFKNDLIHHFTSNKEAKVIRKEIEVSKQITPITHEKLEKQLNLFITQFKKTK